MYCFKLTGGSHVEDGVTYARGDEVTTHRNLITMFPNKFVLMETLPDTDVSPELSKPPIPIPNADVRGTADSEVPQSIPSVQGENIVQDEEVTTEFVMAGAYAVIVYRSESEKGYYVVDSKTSKRLNIKALRKGDVDQFIKEYFA